MNNDLESTHSEANQDEIQAAFDYLENLGETPQQIDSPEALEAVERELRKGADELIALLLQKHLQENLDSEEQLTKEAELDKALAWTNEK